MFGVHYFWKLPYKVFKGVLGVRSIEGDDFEKVPNVESSDVAVRNPKPRTLNPKP